MENDKIVCILQYILQCILYMYSTMYSLHRYSTKTYLRRIFLLSRLYVVENGEILCIPQKTIHAQFLLFHTYIHN